MFERFTERSRQVVVLAQDEARALGHNYIGMEHILLGLLREEKISRHVCWGASTR
jgi:ATP-dependent Clp protease ATP-binding subunit ClpC